MKEECSNCKYFLYIEDYKGICRRYPKEIEKAQFDWCGEWKLRRG